MQLVTENKLDEWSRSSRSEAQSVVVELVARLIRQTVPDPSRRRIPLGDSLNQPGADIVLESADPVGPFVPGGLSFWEIGTGGRAGQKATRDYRELTRALSDEELRTSTFVFLTPLSGVREHADTWSPEQQSRWIARRTNESHWRDVRVVDGTQLVDWLGHYPVVEEWLARKIGIVGGEFESAEARWATLSSVGLPPLQQSVFLRGRESAQELVNEALRFEKQVIQLDTHYPKQVADFVVACIEALDEEVRRDVRDRTAIVGDPKAFAAFVETGARHVLVVDFDTSLNDDAMRRPLERARQKGHSVIMAGLRGGTPDPQRTDLAEPSAHMLEEALVECGFDPERSRVLAQQSDGNLGSLIRSFRMLPAIPDWALGNHAGDLAIAQLAGAWDEGLEGDRRIMERLCGSDYGSWIVSLRNLLNQAGTPLRHAETRWRVSPRYEAWLAPHSHVFDEHLDRFRAVATEVLSEVDPKFDLPGDQRFMAAIRDKVLSHSSGLRTGMADTLALLGSQPEVRMHCSTGKGISIAFCVARDVLASDDWRLWASLGDQLPLLAEAAPDAFLDSVEKALDSERAPLVELFAQEGDGLTGWNYMSGVLWALETLAWDPRWLTRVLVALGRLTEMDPGGTWANRPDASMANILLPWHRQTIATTEQRVAALKTLAREHPVAAWKLLQRILPDTHQMTSGSRKPAWRRSIPEDWTPTVTTSQYFDEINACLEVAIELAEGSVERLSELVPKLDDLPQEFRARVLAVFSKDSVLALPEGDRATLWRSLDELARRHRKYAHAKWALDPGEVDAIEAVCVLLAPASPSMQHRPLFSERQFDLFDGEDDMDAQLSRLEARRRQALKEILELEGLESVIALAGEADAPWRVGFSLGSISSRAEDEALLPCLLDDDSSSTRQLASGYARGRLASSDWSWVDGLDLTQWGDEQLACLLGLLPLCSEAWTRAAQHLGDDSHYWRVAGDNPFEIDSEWCFAASRFAANGRPWMALEVLGTALHKGEQLDVAVAVAALKDAVSVPCLRSHDIYTASKVIETLQNDSSVSLEDLVAIEWAYLAVLDESHGDVRPLTLHLQLASEPGFFCEVLRLGFPLRGEDRNHGPALSAEQSRVAENAWRLLEGWRRIPGSRDDGTVDGQALETWWASVSPTCTESGHLGIAENRLGHVLAFAPPDPNGLWIDRQVAGFLNTPDMDDLRRGFSTGRYNSRGMHSFSRGRAEAGIADEYGIKADELQREGFHRLADTISRLADSYRADSARDARLEDRE